MNKDNQIHKYDNQVVIKNISTLMKERALKK